MTGADKQLKELRWNMRVSEREDAIVRAASDSSDESFAEFVRAAAVREAHRVLADRTEFELGSEDWEKFKELLNRPARVPPGLRDLFSRPTVFD